MIILHLRFLGGFWRLAIERISWNSPAAQTAQGHQEETGQEDPGYDQENKRWRLWEVLEGIFNKVSFLQFLLPTKRKQVLQTFGP